MIHQYTERFLDSEEGATESVTNSQSVRALSKLLYGQTLGFTLNPFCYQAFLSQANLCYRIEKVLEMMKPLDPESLTFWSNHIKHLITTTPIPKTLRQELEENVQEVSHQLGRVPEFAVHTVVAGEAPNRHAKRGKGADGLSRAVLESYASLFDDDVIEHRKRFGFSNLNVTLLVSVRSKAGVELAVLAKRK